MIKKGFVWVLILAMLLPVCLVPTATASGTDKLPVVCVRVNGNWAMGDLTPYKGQDNVWVEVPIDPAWLNGVSGESWVYLRTNVIGGQDFSDTSADLYATAVSDAAGASRRYLDAYCDAHSTAQSYTDRELNVKIEIDRGNGWETLHGVNVPAQYATDHHTVLGQFAGDGQWYNATRQFSFQEMLSGIQNARVLVNMHIGQNIEASETYNGYAYDMSQMGSFYDDGQENPSDTVPSITSVQLVLNSVLGLGLKADLVGENVSDYTVEVTLADGKTQILTGSENQKENGLYLYTAELMAHQLTDAIQIRLKKGDTVISSVENWTVKSGYVDAVLSDAGVSERTKALTSAMYHYGQYAAYYKGVTDDPAIGEVMETALDLSSYGFTVKTANAALGATANLYLDEACDLVFKFRKTAMEGMTLYVDGNAVDTAQINDTQVGYKITGILPQDYDVMHTVTVKNGDAVVYDIRYGVLSYIHQWLQMPDGKDEKLTGLVKAICLYGWSAEDYLTEDTPAIGERRTVQSLNGIWELAADTAERTYLYKDERYSEVTLSAQSHKLLLNVTELPAGVFWKLRARVQLEEGTDRCQIGIRVGGGQWTYTDVSNYCNGQPHWIDLRLQESALKQGSNTVEICVSSGVQAKLIPENGSTVQLKGAVCGDTWVSANVPTAAEKSLSTTPNEYNGIVWYRRIFTPQELSGGSWWLCFDAADYRAEVWLNGHFLGSHEGGYTAFDFYLEGLLNEGENELVVRVTDQQWDTAQADDDISIKETLAGFVQDTRLLNYSGLWQNVYLELRGAVFSRDIYVNTLDISGRIEASVTLQNPQNTEQTVTVKADVKQGPYAEKTVTVAANSAVTVTIPMTVENPRLWTAETPNLYTLTVTVSADGTTDTVRQSFGIRTVDVSGTKVRVNGKPVFLTGLLHWGSYYDNYTPAVSVEQVRYELMAMKEDGFNAVKYCLLSPPDYILELCDEIGIYVYIEYPIWNPTESEAFFERAYLQMMEMVRKDRRFTSVIMSDFNCEDLEFSEPMDKLMQWCVETAKEVAPNRLYTDNSSNGDHRYGDFATCHPYYQLGAFEAMIDGWIQERGNTPLILGEFGDISVLRDLGELKLLESEDYTWYHDYYGDIDQAEVMRQAGYTEAEIDTVIGQSVLNAQEIRKFFLEASKQNSNVAGLFLTHISESPNGWADGWFDDLNQKHFDPEVISPAASATALLLEYETVNYRAGGTAVLGAGLSHYNGQDYGSAKLTYTLSNGNRTVQTGTVRENISLPNGDYYSLGDITVNFPTATEAVCYTLTLTLTQDGTAVTQNSWKLWAYPTEAYNKSDIAIYTSNNTLDLAQYYPNAKVFTSAYSNAKVLITTHIDEKVTGYLERGGKVVYVGLGSGPVSAVESWDYDRMSFAFLGQPDNALAKALKCQGYGGLQFRDLATQWYMDGSETAEGNLIGRYNTTLGTIGSYLGEYSVGNGILLQTTLRLGTEGYTLGGDLLTHETLSVRSGDNPLGSYLLDQMVRYLYEK